MSMPCPQELLMGNDKSLLTAVDLYVSLEKLCFFITVRVLIAAVIYWDKPNEVNGSIIQAVFYCDANEAVLFISQLLWIQ